jgi:hypothetical protein
LRSLLLQIFYSLRSERMLIEQLQYNLLFRWFVGMEMDEAVWNHAVYSKNRERLAQSSRDLVQPDFATGHSSWDISQRQGTGRENRSVRANFKQPRAALRLDRHRGFDLRYGT